MPRKGSVEKWEALTPKYRARLERSGYTREDYLAGRSRQAARGHRATPERPSRVVGREDQFPAYMAKRGHAVSDTRRQALADKVENWVRLDRSVRRYDINEINTHVRNMSPDAFRHAERMTWNEWRDLASVGATRYGNADDVLSEWEFAYYDPNSGHYINPFWYH